MFADHIKIMLRPAALRRPDFPITLSMAKEITKSDSVLELGANVGGNSRDLARYAGAVYSFEPATQCFRWLLKNTNGIPNIRCYNAAVSGETRAAQSFNVQYGSGSLFNHDVIDFGKRVRVPVIGINDLPFRWNVGVFDCEGAEVPILREFRHFNVVDRFYIETHVISGRPTKPFVEKTLLERGYEVSEDVDPSGAFPWVVARRR